MLLTHQTPISWNLIYSNNNKKNINLEIRSIFNLNNFNELTLP